MAVFQYNSFRSSEDISPGLQLVFWGKEDCVPGHTVGPGVRDLYKIHFVHKGKGVVRAGTEAVQLVAGQAFLIWPDIVYYYKADDEDPWTYSWIGFEGSEVQELLSRTFLTPEMPIFSMDSKVMPTLYDHLSDASLSSAALDLRLNSIFYEFLATWVETAERTSTPAVISGRGDQYVHQTLEFLHTHYNENISLADHADSLGIDRKHLSTLFKKSLDIPPRQYLLHYRMDRACDLLVTGKYTVGEVARSVGYQDPLLFSRMFKKIKGIPPSMYSHSLK
ncbi:AraC-type DNA-binding protein [Fontibacillus panacisegetis]|uniref:AraC-type DNA-binding protein n=1 Tax=Fontibacillus panacisegetis TaxID=670482 RepID=A0A1G7MEU6_9BACL|nr:AraC family transcriptional regulator [Fontibacillus panacisegetis]SDF60114.1 AraC-type DNA-binding protein [Fontibacillus panacisegetis]